MYPVCIKAFVLIQNVMSDKKFEIQAKGKPVYSDT
jgi:hypothetical protein